MSTVASMQIVADWALLEDGFAAGIRITIEDGTIVSVLPDSGEAGGERVGGALLPGMVDLHSHAFQRSFAGRAEFAGGGGDFWSWREAMYRAADRIEPDTLAPIMAYLGMEKLKGGYTSTVEFHYLQHGRGGVPYDDRAAMARALEAGAREAGIGLTILFGLYETSGFDGAALEPGQMRFANGAADALAMMQAMHGSRSPDLLLGIAPHSLRAVRPESLADAVSGVQALDAAAPIHIHVAEQRKEVESCVAARGARPVEWLLANAPVDARWCLIHATHTSGVEIAGMAASGCVAGLCSSTEGNLGDGFFSLRDFAVAGGKFGVGLDSNVCLDAFAELRLMEYVQRLRAERRNVLAGASGHSGRILWQAASGGGAQAAGRAVGRIAPGSRADFIVIEPTEETAGDAPDFWLDAAVFARDGRGARHVMQGGRWQVRDFAHVREAPITRDYRAALARLAA